MRFTETKMKIFHFLPK